MVHGAAYRFKRPGELQDAPADPRRWRFLNVNGSLRAETDLYPRGTDMILCWR